MVNSIDYKAMQTLSQAFVAFRNSVELDPKQQQQAQDEFVDIVRWSLLKLLTNCKHRVVCAPPTWRIDMGDYEITTEVQDDPKFDIVWEKLYWPWNQVSILDEELESDEKKIEIELVKLKPGYTLDVLARRRVKFRLLNTLIVFHSRLDDKEMIGISGADASTAASVMVSFHRPEAPAI